MSESKPSTEERILEVAKNFRMSLREAHVYVTGSDPGANNISEAAVKELASRWKKYCSLLSDK